MNRLNDAISNVAYMLDALRVQEELYANSQCKTCRHEEQKGGRVMNRLNDAISNVAYILDALIAFRNVVDSGDCNRCEKKKTCEHAPKPGKLVRYNCPFYEQEEE